MTLPVKRTVELLGTHGEFQGRILVTLTDEGDGIVKLDEYSGGEPTGYYTRASVTEWLDLFVSLFPDNVAYQFGDKSSGD